MDLIAMFVGGLLGSSHCVGMCGGFALTIGASPSRLPPALMRQLIYSAGRIFTYGFLGSMAGLIGSKLIRVDLPLVAAQQVLAIVAGVMMLVIGLHNLGWIRFRRPTYGCSNPTPTLFGSFVIGRSFGASFLAGVFTGFLPCGLVYTFLAFSMSWGSPVRGWVGMACFGLGTVPIMVALGCGSSLLSKAMRTRVHQFASCFVILLGIATVWRGIPREAPCCERIITVGEAAQPETLRGATFVDHSR